MNRSGIVNLDKFLRDLKQIEADVREKPKEAALKIGAAVERQAKINASTGRHKPGEPHIPGTGPGPNRATNRLHNSITSYGRPVGFDRYQVLVGPTIEYARDVEFGAPHWRRKSDGTLFPPGEGYPYFRPAVDGLRRMGAYDTILKQVWQGTALEKKGR
jgi:hypothetical protein